MKTWVHRLTQWSPRLPRIKVKYFRQLLLQQLRVNVVEDTYDTQQLICHALQKLGHGFHLKSLEGEQLRQLSETDFIAIAQCYKDIFNESWGESWTLNAALAEVKSSLKIDENRTPIASLLYHGENIIGFGWGILVKKRFADGRRYAF